MSNFCKIFLPGFFQRFFSHVMQEISDKSNILKGNFPKFVQNYIRCLINLWKRLVQRQITLFHSPETFFIYFVRSLARESTRKGNFFYVTKQEHKISFSQSSHYPLTADSLLFPSLSARSLVSFIRIAFRAFRSNSIVAEIAFPRSFLSRRL